METRITITETTTTTPVLLVRRQQVTTKKRHRRDDVSSSLFLSPGDGDGASIMRQSLSYSRVVGITRSLLLLMPLMIAVTVMIRNVDANSIILQTTSSQKDHNNRYHHQEHHNRFTAALFDGEDDQNSAISRDNNGDSRIRRRDRRRQQPSTSDSVERMNTILKGNKIGDTDRIISSLSSEDDRWQKQQPHGQSVTTSSSSSTTTTKTDTGRRRRKRILEPTIISHEDDNHDGNDHHRLVAIWNIGEKCPPTITSQRWDQYTHILVTWLTTTKKTTTTTTNTTIPDASISTTCTDMCEWQLPTPPSSSLTSGGGDDDDPADGCDIFTVLLPQWKDAGLTVWWGIGGPDMGVVSEDRPIDLIRPACWEFCFGKAEQTINAIVDWVDITNNNNNNNNNTQVIDGIVFAYHYHYQNTDIDDGNGGSSLFLRGPAAKQYIRDVTVGLRSTLPPNISIVHMPLDKDMVIGSEYFTMLVDIQQQQQQQQEEGQQQQDQRIVDYLILQYYHGAVIPSVVGTDAAPTQQSTSSAATTATIVNHFDTVATFLFGGDASKVFIGLCAGGDYCVDNDNNNNNDMIDYSVDSVQATTVVKAVLDVYPCYGGIVFWNVMVDPGGVWSTPLLNEIQQYHNDTCHADDPTNNGDINDEDDVPDSKNCTELVSCDDCVSTVGCNWCTHDATTGHPSCRSSSEIEAEPLAGTNDTESTLCSSTCEETNKDGATDNDGIQREPWMPTMSPASTTGNSSTTSPTSSPGTPSDSSYTNTGNEHHFHIEGLTQQIYGIVDLPLSSSSSPSQQGEVVVGVNKEQKQSSARSVLESIFQRHVEAFFSTDIGQNLFVSTNITITNVVQPNLVARRRVSRRSITRGDLSSGPYRRTQARDELPEGSSIIITFDQDITYSALITEEILSIDALVASPFQTDSARRDYTAMLKESKNSILQDIIGVSEIIIPPLPPSNTPIVPPIQPVPLPTGLPSFPPSPVLPTTQPIIPPSSTAPPPPRGTTGPTQVTVQGPSSDGGGNGNVDDGPSQAPGPGGWTGDTGDDDEDNDNGVVGTSMPSGATFPQQSSPPAIVIATHPPVEPPATPDVVPTSSPPVLSPTMNPVDDSNSNTDDGIQKTSSNQGAEYDDDGVFGPYTGLIALFITFGGLLVVFMVSMKWYYGEYAD